MSSESVVVVVSGILTYLLLAMAVGFFVFLPWARQTALRASRRALAAVAQLPLRWADRMRSNASSLGRNGMRCAQHLRTWARRNRVALAAAAVIVTAPTLLALILRPDIMLEGFDDAVPASDPVIASLLHGEQLVPPPPLPPAVFVTRQVEVVRPALGSASRDWDALDTDFRQRLLAVFRIMRSHGYEMALLEGYRSPQRQDYLASLGRSVTSAAAFQSYHQFGLAADCAFYLGGRLVIDEKDPWAMRGYKLYGEASEAAGLTWGGRWKMMDFGHVELRRGGILHRKR
jgi:peptidoglycan L-alanyl-D-glutamate endopeptidase CwlK